jgi:DNA polymerase I-like protein with 3'-5' exonuclease and polymerase domains
VGKSTGLAALMPDKDWFQDQLPDVNKHVKDAVMALDGKWLIEIAEMNAIRKADREAVKQFASVRYDKIRRPYARHVSTRARRCHMACTHNPGADDGYFTDSTGSRRWLPVEVGLVHVDRIKKDRDQLWAEALVLYRKGFNWWLEPEEVGVLVEQRKRFRVSDSADEAFHYLEYQPVITDSSNPTNLVIEWRKRDKPLTAFVPKYFWQDRFDQDWVKAPYMVKQDINGAFQNKGWLKVSRRFPELASEHNDPTSRCLRAWIVEDDTGVEDPGTPEISNTTETNARHIEECRGVEQPTSETAPVASGVEEEVLNPDKCNDVCDSPKSLKEEKKDPPLYTDTPLYTIEDIEDKENKALASERVRESYSETGRGRRGVSPRRLLDFDAFLARFGKDEVVGLDLETTSLSPRTGRVRLIQVYRDNAFAYLDLDKVGGLASLRAQLEGRNFVAFNAAFELTWFKDAGIEACFDDAMLAYSAVYGGGTNLKDAAQKVLGIEIDKTQQRSDWSGDLTDEQITYALRDAEYASMLWSRLVPEMTEYGVLDGYYLMLDAIPAINAMSDNGMGFDLPAHNELIQTWVAQKEEHENTIDSFTTTVENWNSPSQIQTWIRELLVEAGVKGSRILRAWPRTKTNNLSVGAPAIREVLGKGNITGELKDLLEAYLRRQDSSKLLSSFGEGLQGKVIDGRLRGSFSIGYAKTGRMTSFKPNLQNLPNTPEFRGLFVAGPGNQIVVADYSQVEVRVGGILGNEKVLEEIFKTGQDVHTTSAAAMFHKDPDGVTKDERKQAKALTFGTQYGMGPLSLSKMMGITREKAVDYLSRWDRIYPALATWRKNSFENGKKSLELRTAGGRRIEIPEDPSPTICFNYPVQGSSADVIYAALKHMAPRYDQLLAVVHDEIVLECPAAESEQACVDLEAAMTQGFLDIFPGSDTTGLVDAVAGDSWAIK